jgi:tRNA (guanine9-N1)-methyltransferase
MSSQLTRCHSENRRSQNTVELFFTTLNGRLQERMETNLHGVHLRWRGVHASTDSYQAVLKDVALHDFVYLTADSPNVLHTLEASKVYILGGLVDRNRYKVSCPLRSFHSN